MSQKLHPETGTLMETIAKKYFPCTCGEIYLSRKLTAPDCPFHANDWESAMEEYASQFKPSPSVSAEDFLKTRKEFYTPDGKFEATDEFGEGLVASAMQDFASRHPPVAGYSREQIIQELKELSKYLDDLCLQTEKDAGHLWIAFTDKFNAFKKNILSSPTPSNWIEIKEGEEKPG